MVMPMAAAFAVLPARRAACGTGLLLGACSMAPMNKPLDQAALNSAPGSISVGGYRSRRPPSRRSEGAAGVTWVLAAMAELEQPSRSRRQDDLAYASSAGSERLKEMERWNGCLFSLS